MSTKAETGQLPSFEWRFMLAVLALVALADAPILAGAWIHDHQPRTVAMARLAELEREDQDLSDRVDKATVPNWIQYTCKVLAEVDSKTLAIAEMYNLPYIPRYRTRCIDQERSSR
jgi:hypothetical protein